MKSDKILKYEKDLAELLKRPMVKLINHVAYSNTSFPITESDLKIVVQCQWMSTHITISTMINDRFGVINFQDLGELANTMTHIALLDVLSDEDIVQFRMKGNELHERHVHFFNISKTMCWGGQ